MKLKKALLKRNEMGKMTVLLFHEGLTTILQSVNNLFIGSASQVTVYAAL